MVVSSRDATFDLFTIGHVATGAVLRSAGVPRFVAYTIFVIVEVVEKMLRDAGSEFFEETPKNVVADLVASIAGYELCLNCFQR